MAGLLQYPHFIIPSIILSITTAYVVFKYLFAALRHRVLARETGIMDLLLIDVPRLSRNKIPGTAVICGGSVVGLMAARVCHDHFESVLIIEPEAWLRAEDARVVDSRTQKNSRSRIMQYDAIHGRFNLSFIYMGLKKLYPNLDQECKIWAIRMHYWGFPYLVPYELFGGSLPKTMWAARRATETLIRGITLCRPEFPNIVQIVGNCVGVKPDSFDPNYLTSVIVREGDTTREIEASLVIDCTGPSQAGIKWMMRAGYGERPNSKEPSIDRLTSMFSGENHYVNFIFDVPPSLGAGVPIPGGWAKNPGALYSWIPDARTDRRFITIIRCEGDVLIVTCGCWGSPDLPDTTEGIKEFMRSLVTQEPVPDWLFTLVDICREVESTMRMNHTRCPPFLWTYFENASNLPANWIAIGDSVCRLNPIYASGCVKGMLGCLALNTTLHSVAGTDSIPKDFGKRFFRAQALKITPMWFSTKAIDYGFSTTKPEDGETLSSNLVVRWYVRHIQILSFKVSSIMWHSQVMFGVSLDLLRPSVIAKVLWNALIESFHSA
ncbi:hypothetical protein C8J56DRAFT_1003295 [Mycena floridula]|nr:hypothetical protein C8J56DRAFT_1003295 [Mycena floridula]